MKNLFILFLFFGLFSCSKSEIEQIEPAQSWPQDIVTDASGRQYPFLDPNVISYCGPGWGRKFCRFLGKYDGTSWVDAGNSDFSGLNFSNFSANEYFISFVNLDSVNSCGEGWKIGETTCNGIKWNIKIKKDQEDILWLDYDYYGPSEGIEYTITYKYEVTDGLLNLSSTEGQTFIFNPS